MVDTSFTSPPVRVDIPGDFTFDAISNSGSRLYLIQRSDSDRYFVRDYVIGTGLDPTIIFDKTDGTAAMSGVRLMGIPSPGGDTLYSIYARKDQSAFIHQLSLDGPIAFCIDLTGPGYSADGRAMRWSLAMARDGGRLFAANGSLGVITEISLERNQQRTVPLGGGAMASSGGAMVSSDGTRVILAGGGIRWLDSATLRTTGTALQSWTVTGIAPAADGASIFAVDGSGRVAELDQQGHVMATFETGVTGAVALMKVESFR